MTVTPTILKTHVETDLTDPALLRLIDDAAGDITKRFGSNISLTEQYNLSQKNLRAGRRLIWLLQAASSVTSVKEGPTLKPADLTTLVDGTDFLLINNGLATERLDADFSERVEIKYVPKTDVNIRDRVIIDLCKLAIRYDGGLSSEKVGDYSQGLVDYRSERNKLLSALNSGRRLWA